MARNTVVAVNVERKSIILSTNAVKMNKGNTFFPWHAFEIIIQL